MCGALKQFKGGVTQGREGGEESALQRCRQEESRGATFRRSFLDDMSFKRRCLLS